MLRKEHGAMSERTKRELSWLEIGICVFIVLYGLVNIVASIEPGAMSLVLGNLILIVGVVFYLWATFNAPALAMPIPPVLWTGLGFIAYSQFGALESMLFFLLAVYATLEWSRKTREANVAKDDTKP